MEVASNIFSGPFNMRQMSRTVCRQRIQVNQHEIASVPALERCSATCSTFEQLSFACQHFVASRVDGIKGGSGAPLMLFRTWHQSVVALV